MGPGVTFRENDTRYIAGVGRSGVALPEPARDPASTALSSREVGSVAVLYGVILATTVVAFGLLFLIAQRYDTAATASAPAVAFVALGILSYLLGLRHGVDADHIAAIDNTTRKLLQEGKRPLTVGTWFSLGHSTIVVGLIVALVFAVRAIGNAIPALETYGSIAGTLVSGTFLFLIGLINVVITVEIYRIFQGLRHGELDEARLEAELGKRGFMNRYFGRLFRVVSSPRQIYPIGVLFGLGFDTATEIAAIGLAVALGGANSAIPLYVILVLPLLFTCGMVLVDTSDGVAMRYAYGWAFLKPIRKVYYNLTVTVISVAVAFGIGGIELLGVVAGEFGLSGGFWDWIGNLDFETVGYVIIGLFVVTWLLAMAYYRYRGFERPAEVPHGPPVGPA